VSIADYFRRLSKRLEDEERLREIAVQQLAHRLKNKIATIQAIISVQLRDNPQVRNGILDRLNALTATDSLIENANGHGAYIRDIASTEPRALRRLASHHSGVERSSPAKVRADRCVDHP
jgi:two-component sensor histidine kinase